MLSAVGQQVSPIEVTVGASKLRLHLELQPLDAEAKAVALKELRESDSVKRESLSELKKLLAEEPSLKWPDVDDWLIKFLRPCKFHASSARDLIKRYFAFKTKHPQIYENLLPSTLQQVFSHDNFTSLPCRDQHGRRILICRMGKYWDHNKVSLNELFQVSVLLLEAFLWEPLTQTHGIVLIYDMQGLSLTQMLKVTPASAKRMVDLVQDALPVRFKAIHIVNQSGIFQTLFKIFKPFLNKKLAARIHFHGEKRHTLFEHVAAECLPPQYGGTLATEWISSGMWHQLLLHYEDEFKAINAAG